MKPRFSILSLFALTGFLATWLAGVVQPLSIWISVSLYLWIVSLTAFACIAMTGRLKNGAFSGGVVAVTLIYCAASVIDGRGLFVPTVGFEYVLPHSNLEDVLFRYAWPHPTMMGLPSDDEVITQHAMHQLAFEISSLACGFLGGSFFAWRYRVCERQLNGNP